MTTLRARSMLGAGWSSQSLPAPSVSPLKWGVWQGVGDHFSLLKAFQSDDPGPQSLSTGVLHILSQRMGQVGDKRDVSSSLPPPLMMG